MLLYVELLNLYACFLSWTAGMGLFCAGSSSTCLNVSMSRVSPCLRSTGALCGRVTRETLESRC